MTYRDRLSQGGAVMLAVEIRNWWAERGYNVQTWTEPVATKDDKRERRIFAVRSDMVNGAPRKMTLDPPAR